MPHQHASFRIHGMDCAEEISVLRRELSRQPGVYDLTFDVLQARMAVEYGPDLTSPDQIAAAVARTGMRSEPWQERPDRLQEPFWARHGRQVMAAVSGVAWLTAMLVMGAASGDFLLALLSHGDGHESLPAGAVAAFAVAILAGTWYSLPKAWRALRDRRADMNVLMAVSIAGALFLGEWSEAATVAFLFALANLMETWSMAKARNAIGALLRITPTEAWVRHGDHEHRTPIDRVAVGTPILVKPGERIPCDGEIVSGRSAIDQALLTGESVPVPKGPGETVYAGTMNGGGALEVRTTRPATDTVLARVLRMVEDSQRRRAPFEQWVERFARRYTPVMLVVAALVAVVPPLVAGGAWDAWFYQSMVILLISCPCALIISTPVTMLAALTSAARRGVLIKGGAFLEAASQVRAFAFDKTGVLTQGDPDVESLVPLNGRSSHEVLARMASLEQQSEHPLGRAIVRHARAAGLSLETAQLVEALPGRGARGRLDGQDLWVGSGRLLTEKHLATEGVPEGLARIGEAAQTVVAFGDEHEVHALLGLSDPVRAHAAEALRSLRGLGVRHLVMLTGDNEEAARRAAASLDLDAVHAGLLPADKAERVAAVQREHGAVAMVGDGINDTQALATASLGIALGARGSDVALETADIVLMSDDLRLLPFLLRHARRTLGVIQQNVVFALATKALFLALAVAGVATLWMAIAADMGATLLVTFNGLRLLRAR